MPSNPIKYPDADYLAYARFANVAGLPTTAPIPVRALGRFIAQMVEDGKSYSTIERRVFGVSAWNKQHGGGSLSRDPTILADLAVARSGDDVQLERVRKTALLPRGVRDVVRAIRQARTMTAADHRDVALVLLARACGAKPGALAALEIADVRFRNEQLHVRLRRAGVTDWISIQGDDDHELDAASAMRAYRAAARLSTPGPLFRAAHRGGSLSQTGLAVWGGPTSSNLVLRP